MATITEPALEAGSDEGLMQRIQADDLRAFEELYDRYSARAFRVARGICGSSHHAEDAVQEGFLALWRSRSSFDPTRGSAQSWLFTVIRRRSFDVMRRTRRNDRRRESDDALGFLLAPDSVEQDAEQHDEAGRVRSSLRQLPVAQREVIALAYFGGLTHTEIAARLQLPAGTVKSRMRIGLQKLRAELNPSSPPHQRQTRTKVDSPSSPVALSIRRAEDPVSAGHQLSGAGQRSSRALKASGDAGEPSHGERNRGPRRRRLNDGHLRSGHVFVQERDHVAGDGQFNRRSAAPTPPVSAFHASHQAAQTIAIRRRRRRHLDALTRLIQQGSSPTDDDLDPIQRAT